MSKGTRPIGPLVAMLIWYGLLLTGSAGLSLIGLMFGSEAYRSKAIPLAELAMIAGPLIISAALTGATVYLWNIGRTQAAYVLCGASVIAVFGFAAFAGALGL